MHTIYDPTGVKAKVGVAWRLHVRGRRHSLHAARLSDMRFGGIPAYLSQSNELVDQQWLRYTSRWCNGQANGAEQLLEMQPT